MVWGKSPVQVQPDNFFFYAFYLCSNISNKLVKYFYKNISMMTMILNENNNINPNRNTERITGFYSASSRTAHGHLCGAIMPAYLHSGPSTELSKSDTSSE